VQATTLAIPSGTVVNAGISASAAIDPTKMIQRHTLTVSQESGTSSSDEVWPAHSVFATGTLRNFEAGSVAVAVGSDAVDVDLLVNGASILSAPITLNSSSVIRTPQVATIDTAALADGDLIEVSIDFTDGGGTPAQGVYATLIWDEQPV
jgi:hypothetical protein